MTETFEPGPDALAFLLDAARAAGATAADASLSVTRGLSVSVRKGDLEGLERSDARGMALRVFYGRRVASVSGSSLARTDLEELAARCASMAKAVPEDRYSGLADPGLLARDSLELELGGDDEPSPEQLERDALEAEAAALAVPEIEQVSGAGASWNETRRWVAATNGFAASRAGRSSGTGLAAVARRGDAMERDYESRSSRFRSDRPDPAEIGRIAGERAAARLGSRKAASQTASVIYDRRVASSLLGVFLGAISGPSVARGVSFLKDKLHEPVFASDVHVRTEPLRPRALGSRAHDGEGLPSREVRLAEGGVLTDWLLNLSSARQLGLAPNGFAAGGFGTSRGVSAPNVVIEAGPLDQDGLMRQAGQGLLITDMFSPSINPNTGDYSVGVAGFWFEKGERVHPVSEVTVAGNLIDMFAHLVPGSDLERRGSQDSPSLLIDGMTLAGS